MTKLFEESGRLRLCCGKSRVELVRKPGVTVKAAAVKEPRSQLRWCESDRTRGLLDGQPVMFPNTQWTDP